MKRLIALLCALALASAASSAQEALPLPTALKTAKTVYLVNGGVNKGVVERTVAELKKWGRFTLVADAEGSDVTMTLTAQPTKQVQIVNIWVPGGIQNVAINRSFLSITATSDGTVLYGTDFGNNPAKELKKLRERLEQE